MARKLTYQPKGSMCAGCIKCHQDCSSLPFKDMQKIGKGDRDGVVVVLCTYYEKRQKAGGSDE